MLPPLERELRLDVHGLTFAIGGDWPEIIDDLRLDMAWFGRDTVTEPPAITVELEAGAPQFDRFGEVTAELVTSHNVVYNVGRQRVVDYFGRAATVIEGGRAVIRGDERNLVYQAAYDFIVSRIGEHLDALQLTRVHSLGVVGRQGAVAVLLPSGGGKSTLALRSLLDERVRLLSDETPLLDRHGRLHPFPMRIAINSTDQSPVPEWPVRLIERAHYHPKLAIDVPVFAHRVERDPQPLRHLVIGRRSLGVEARLDRIPRRSGLPPLLRDGVIGLGVLQGAEFLLQRGARDVVDKAGIAARRTRCCLAALAHARYGDSPLGAIQIATGRSSRSCWSR